MRSITAAALPVASLVCGYPGDYRRLRGLLVVQAYVDDSLESGKVLVLGGLVATAERWERFSDAWQERLNAAPWSRFKMSEVWNRGGEVNLEHAKWHYLTLRDYAQGAIAMVIPLAPLKRVVEETRIRGAAENPYLWAIKGIINVTAQGQRNWELHSRVDFIFDERGEKRKVIEAWDSYKATIPPEVQAVTGRVPIFEDDERLLPLQAADMWAWWCRRKWLEKGTLIGQGFPIPWGTGDDLPTMIYEWSEADMRQEFAVLRAGLDAAGFQEPGA